MNPTRAARHGLTLAWRNLLKLKHSPDQLLDVLLLPITFVLVFVFLFGKAVAGDWHTYLNYVLPGIAVQALMFASMGTALALNADLRTTRGSSTGSAASQSPARRRSPGTCSATSSRASSPSPWCSASAPSSASDPTAARWPCSPAAG